MIYLNECIICESDDIRIFENNEVLTTDFTVEKVNRCNVCGLIWLSPHMSDEHYKKYYGNDQYSRDRRGGGIDLQDKAARFNALRLYRGVLPYLKNGDALDVGCGLGKFMDNISYRYNCTGIDPSPTFTHHKAIVGFFPDDMPDGQYDLISVIHSVEHLNDPIGALNRVKELLKPDGTLIVEYPDIGIKERMYPSSILRFMKAHQW